MKASLLLLTILGMIATNVVTGNTICEEVRSAVFTSALTKSGNLGVLNGIMDILGRTIQHRVGGYFVVVYNDVSGSDKHWGSTMCTSFPNSLIRYRDFYRMNGHNVRVLYKNHNGRQSRVGAIRICRGCGVWYNSYGMDVEYKEEGNFNRFNVYWFYFCILWYRYLKSVRHSRAEQCKWKYDHKSYTNIIWFCNDSRLFARLAAGKFCVNVIKCYEWKTWNKLFHGHNQGSFL